MEVTITKLSSADIEWQGAVLDKDTVISSTDDLINYIKTLKDDNTSLKEQNNILEEKNTILENYITNYANTEYRLWNYDNIHNLDSDKYFAGTSNYTDVSEMANYIVNIWDKEQTYNVTSYKDGSKKWTTEIKYPVRITNKKGCLDGVDNKYYQSLSTYAYPDEIYACFDNVDDKVVTMSRREYEFLTKQPSEYTYGVLSNNHWGYEYWKDLYEKYYGVFNNTERNVTQKKPKYLTDDEISDNAKRYTRLKYYYDLSGSLTKYDFETTLNKVYKEKYPNASVTSYIPDNYMVVYKLKNIKTGEFVNMFRDDYNMMTSSECSNYEMYYTFRIDSNDKKDLFAKYNPVLNTKYNRYFITISKSEYNSIANKSVLTKFYTYVLKENLDLSVCESISDGEYNSLSGDERLGLVEYRMRDEAYPNNKYAYVTRDCNVNPEVYDYDLHTWGLLTDVLLSLSLAYYYKRDERYYDKFVEQLKIFFINQETRMLPKYLYSQFHPGYKGSYANSVGSGLSFDYKTNTYFIGQAGGLIDTQYLVDIIEAIKFMNSVKSIGIDVYIGIQQWFKELVHWMYEGEFAKAAGNNEYVELDDYVEKYIVNHPDENQPINYWCNLYIFSKFANTYDNYVSAFQKILTRHINVQIDDNGVMPGEARRSNGLSYSVLNIKFMVNAAILFGREYTRTNLTKVRDALKVLQKFTNMSKSEFVKQTWIDVYGKKGAAGSVQNWTESGNYDNEISKLKFEINRFINLWPDCGLTKENISDSVIYSNREYIVK